MSKPWMKPIKTAGFAILLPGITAIAAHAEPAPAFEVATVKASPPRAGTAGLIAMTTASAMLQYSDVSMKDLLAMAKRSERARIRGGSTLLNDHPYESAA